MLRFSQCFLIFFCLVSRFASGGLILHGDRIVELLDMASGGGGAYCLWLNASESEILRETSTDWQIKLLTPAGGMVFKATGQPSVRIPYELFVQLSPGSPYQRVRPNDNIAQGRRLSGHCEPGLSSFLLQVQPLGEPNLVPGGLYQATLPVEITASNGEKQAIDLVLRLHVPERVSARVLENIVLPRFEGASAPSGEARVCLFRNGGGNYSVRLQGDGANGAFVLNKKVSIDGRKELPFFVTWQGGRFPAVSLEPGESSRVYGGSPHQDCQGAANALVQVTLPAQEAQRAGSGSYQGRLKIIVQAR